MKDEGRIIIKGIIPENAKNEEFRFRLCYQNKEGNSIIGDQFLRLKLKVVKRV